MIIIKLKKRTFYVILLLLVLFVILLFMFPNENTVRDVSMGVISGNIVALVLTLIEYDNERRKVLEDFLYEVRNIQLIIYKNLNLHYLVPSLSDFFLKDRTEEFTNIDKMVMDFVKKDENVEKLKKSMESIEEISRLTSIELGKLFSRYHGFFSIKYSQDKVRNHLYEVYLEIRTILVDAQNLNHHFQKEKEKEKLGVDYFNIVWELLKFMKTHYCISYGEKDVDRIYVYEDYRYKIDTKMYPILEIMNYELKPSDYNLYCVSRVWNKKDK